MNDDSINPDRQSSQCDFDLEDRSSRQKAGFTAPYTCAVCGADAEIISNLCAPEFNPKAPGTNRPQDVINRSATN
jgi:hypothetical protein